MIDWKRVEELKEEIGTDGFVEVVDMFLDEAEGAVRALVAGLPAEQFFCPGSIVRLDIDPSQPIGFGMLPQNAAFFSFSSAYDVTPGPDVRVVARYGAKDTLMSGWLEGEQAIASLLATETGMIRRGK